MDDWAESTANCHTIWGIATPGRGKVVEPLFLKREKLRGATLEVQHTWCSTCGAICVEKDALPTVQRKSIRCVQYTWCHLCGPIW
eukprot:3065676-Pyramimonas_sp.AAC.1